jgi:hypothetical protein
LLRNRYRIPCAGTNWGQNPINFSLAYIALHHLAAKLRAGGLRRDGDGVRRACCAIATGSLALGDPATLRHNSLRYAPLKQVPQVRARTHGSIRVLRPLS